MAVIRPPWVTKEDFYRTPFNFCNRWCERCQLINICKVYQEGERDKKRAIGEGKDPNSWEIVAEVMHKNIAKTMKHLEKGAKKWGIDWEELNRFDEKEYQKFEEEQERLRNHPVQKRANRWSDHIHAFLNKFTEVPVEVPMTIAVEAQEVLSWYQPLVPAKIFRALDSNEREKGHPEELRSYDEKSSAFIAYNGLIEVSYALMRLATEKSLRNVKNICLFLSQESLDLAQLLSKTFYFDDGKGKAH